MSRIRYAICGVLPKNHQKGNRNRVLNGKKNKCLSKNIYNVLKYIMFFVLNFIKCIFVINLFIYLVILLNNNFEHHYVFDDNRTLKSKSTLILNIWSISTEFSYIFSHFQTSRVCEERKRKNMRNLLTKSTLISCRIDIINTTII